MDMRRFLVLVAAVVLTGSICIAQEPSDRASEVVRMDGADYYLHTVLPGETVYSLSRLYGVDEARLYDDNPAVKTDGLKAGQTIRILCTDRPEIKMTRRKLQRTFSRHTIQPGETTYSIAKKYSLSINTLIQDNPGLDPAHLRAGDELLIRKSEMDKTSPQTILSQMDDFAETLTAVSDEYVYHLVEMGETLYALSRRYGVSVEAIEAENNVKEGLKAGVLLKIPVPCETLAGNGSDTMENGMSLPPVGGVAGDMVDMKYLPGGVTNVAFMLPLTEKGAVKPVFMEFYQGALLAARELAAGGKSLNIDLYDTERSPQKVATLIDKGALDDTDLIIGPVYEETLGAVVGYSRANGIPVVSPLADVPMGYGNTVFRLYPERDCHYEKLASLLDGDKNIIFITSDVNDAEFERRMKEVVGNRHYQRIVYRKGTPSEQIDDLLMKSGTENVFVVLAGDETGVDLILAALSSVQNSRLARSIRTGRMSVIGNSKWMRYRNLDRNLFFKLNVSFVTSYHADRGNERVQDFDSRYIEAFGRIPTLYSYRGYDAVMLFCGGQGAGGMLSGDPVAPLQTPYGFEMTDAGDICNTQWALVTYSGDYTINVR